MKTTPISRIHFPEIALAVLAGLALHGVARAATYDQCLWAMNDSAANALSLSGSVTVNASNCGVVVDSSSSTALRASGSVHLTAKYIQVNGGVSTSGSVVLTPTPQTHVSTPTDPLSFLVPPSSSQCDYTDFKISGSSSATLNPGTYCNGITISGSANVSLNPGVYIMLGGGLKVSGSVVMNGIGVTFFLTAGQGHSYGPLSVSGSSTLNLSAPTSGPYYGILFYQNPAIGTSQPASAVSGSSASTINGVFYFPTTGLTYSGSANQGNYLILVADTITLTGSVTINGNFPGPVSPLTPPLTVSLAPTSITLQPGQTRQFTATVANAANPAVTWTSTPAGVGSINSSGLYTAPATFSSQQIVTITATSVENPAKSATATITLLPPISVVVAPGTAVLYGGQAQQFTAAVANTSNTAVVWTLNPAGVGSINASGLYTAPASISAQQTVTVAATSQADPTKSAVATVTLMPPVAVSVAPATATLSGTKTQQFTATVINSSNKAVTWSVTGAGSVDANGLYTAPGIVGTQQPATVKATSQADTTKSASATVTLIPVTITLAPSTVTLYSEQTQQFSPTVSNAANTSVTWSINPAGVGTITAAGLYTAPVTIPNQQSVTIIATSQADTSKTASSTVTLVPLTITVAPITSTLFGGQTKQFTSTLTNANNTNVTWSVTPATGAGTIDANGLYTAPATVPTQQNVTIKAVSQIDASKSATATVTLVPVTITIAPTTTTLAATQMQQFTATVTNAASPNVTWSINPAGTGTISTSGLYAAPASVASQQNITVIATSQADTTKTASATVTLLASGTTSITPSSVSLSASQTQQFAATLPGNTSVTWSLSPAGAGTVSATGLYTAPNCITVQQVVTLTATGSTDSTKTISATITLKSSSGYSFQRTIIIDHTQVLNTDQINFPVLFSGTYPYLADVAHGGKVQTGFDIVFTSDAAGTKRLNHELEGYDPTTGKISAWVQVPVLSSSADTILYLFYGNSAVTTSQQNITGVWDSTYKAVYHFAGATVSGADSTANGNTMTLSNVTAGTGQFGAAAQFNGTNSYGVIPPVEFGTYSSNYSVSFQAWVKAGSDGVILSQTDGTLPGGTPAADGFDPVIYNNSTNGVLANGVFEGGTHAPDIFPGEVGGSIDDGAWHFVSYSYANNAVTLRIDGSEVATNGPMVGIAPLLARVHRAAMVGSAPGHESPAVSPVGFGSATTLAYFLGAGYWQNWFDSTPASWKYLTGAIDEVRISSVARSSDWTAAEYANQSSPQTFYSISAENAVNVFVAPVTGLLYPAQTQQFSATVSGTCSSAVTWSVTPAGAGTITAAGFYTAPSNTPAEQTVTVTATSVGAGTAMGVASLVLEPLISVSVSPKTATLTASQTIAFNATLVNAPPYAGVSWSVNGLGSIDFDGNYTAPSTIPSQQTVTVVATSLDDDRQSGTATITLINANSFNNHRAIQIDHTKVPNTDQINFPVLISGVYPFLANVANGGKVQNLNGSDIIFTSDCNGVNQVSHEIESYDPVTGQLIAWVSVPILSHTADTVIYISYGNSAITTSTESPAGVWEPNYAGVYHLSKSGTLSTNDSVVPDNVAGTNSGATAVAGIIGGGVNFNGTSKIVVNPNVGFFTANTTSVWFNTSVNQSPSDGHLLDRDGNRFGGGIFGFDLNLAGSAGNKLRFETFNSAGTLTSPNGNLNDGKWHYAVGTFDTNTTSLYIDGQRVATGPSISPLNSNGVPLTLGGGVSFANAFYRGSLDEARISNSARSADWIATEYNNQGSPATFYTVLSENGAGISVAPSGLALYPLQTRQFTPTIIGTCATPTLTWSINPAGVGTITSGGLYTAPSSIASLQTITVTAQSQTDATLLGSATAILLPPASVSVSPSAAKLFSNETEQFIVSLSNVVDSTVTWSVNPSGVGSVSATGLYTAPANITALQTIQVIATSHADPTKSAFGTVTLAPGQGSSSSAGAFDFTIGLIEQALCRRPHVGPTIDAGPDQFTSLACGSGPCAATVTLNANVPNYSLGPGDTLAYTWIQQSGPAAALIVHPTAASTDVSFSVAGNYTFQLSVNDGVATSVAVTNVFVGPASSGNASLYMTPTVSGPNRVGSAVVLQIKAVGFNGGVFNFQGLPLQITVTGANPSTATVTTDSNGTATFSYLGNNAGTDSVAANSGGLFSVAVPVTWVNPAQRLSSLPVTGQFFTNDSSGVFNTPLNQQPLFIQTFPNIMFNPAAGVVANNTSGVTNLTRPFTDLVADPSGNFVGSIPGQGNNYQAGIGNLYNFSAVFTGAFQVPAAGAVTFTFSSDDAYIFGVAGASRVSGPQTNTPATSPFKGYTVMGGLNQRSAAAQSTIVVNFPAAGTYPYEVDYAKGGDKNLTLTMLASGAPIPAGYLLTLTPNSVPSMLAGQIESFVITGTDASGIALASLAATANVTGPNQQSRQLTTDGTGQVTFAYAGSPFFTGIDVIQATASLNGVNISTNVVSAPWNNGTNQAPVVSAGSAQTITLPASAILYGSATDDGLPANSSLTITWTKQSGPGDVTFDNPNQAATGASFSTAGSYVLQLTASDGALTTSSTVTVTVNASAGWSNGWLGSPLDGSTVTQPVPISLITGITLTSGTLKIYPASNQTAFTLLNPSTTGTGQIGTLDPTTLTNGSYFIELRATNSQGVTQTNLAMVDIAGDYKPGRVTATVTDLVVPAPGLPIQIQRTYDSLVRATSGDFGQGWNLGISVQVDVSPTSDVTFTLNGRRRTFYFTPPANSVFTYWYTPQYTPEAGLHGSLATTGDNCNSVLQKLGQVWQCAINNAGTSYQPTGYRYTDPGGRVYTLGPNGAIQSIQDLNGNTLTVTATGISSSNGLNVPFVRDVSGRITKITDTLGHAYLYGYDSSGNLTSVTYPGVATPATYVYDPTHLLTKEVDPRGNVSGQSLYYPDGRLMSITDAAGNQTSFSYDIANLITTTTNPDGGTEIVQTDSYGHTIRQTDPLGRTRQMVYDSNQNLTQVTDGSGKTTHYGYDSNGFRTMVQDPLGNTGNVTFNAYGGPTQIKDPLNNIVAATYDSHGQPTLVSDSIGQVASATYDGTGLVRSVTNGASVATNFNYDSRGNLSSRTDSLNRVTSYTYDGMNRLQSVTNPRGGQTTYTYDALDTLIQTQDPAGKITKSEYDANGNRTATVDGQGHRTTRSFDAANRISSITYPDGSSATFTYDWRGNVLLSTDQSGHVTKYEYDLDGQTTKITRAFGTTDATSFAFTYDASGRQLTRTDATGRTETYGYDDAGHRTSITDSENRTVRFSYDADSHLIGLTDANGRTTAFAYDSRGRRNKTTYPDGTSTSITYGVDRRILSTTDQAGRVTNRTYDAQGQLATVTDPRGDLSSFVYDNNGNTTQDVDANNHSGVAVFDVLNRPVSETRPTGGSALNLVYDDSGNLASVTDHKGHITTYGYDSSNRLVQISPDPVLGETNVVFTYTPTGQRATMADASGTTSYTYDNQDRLISKATSQGGLTYTYDAAGNVASMKSSNSNGVNVAYTYDGSHRLLSVVDNGLPAGQNTTTYSYDGANNLAAVLYPSGVTHTFRYDTLNRQTGLNVQRTASLADYAYTLDPVGHRIGVLEQTGRSTTYSYDAAYRLTNEIITNDPNSINGAVTYTLDAVANRTAQASSLPGIPASSATYNANDELGTDAYDANGNTIASGGTTYAYTFDDRIKTATTAAGAVSLVYDGNEARVGKVANGVSTRYLVDDLNPTGYPQVVEELVGGNVQRRYTWGTELISQTQSIAAVWKTGFYGYDGVGTIRFLTDSSGAVTDHYDYDAWGNIVHQDGTTPNNYLYRSEQFDSDLSLYYLRARYYQPKTGRFLTSDPAKGDKSRPISFHKYLYAEGDPIQGQDPSGRGFETVERAEITVEEAEAAEDLIGEAEEPTEIDFALAGIELAEDIEAGYPLWVKITAGTVGGGLFVCIMNEVNDGLIFADGYRHGSATLSAPAGIDTCSLTPHVAIQPDPNPDPHPDRKPPIKPRPTRPDPKDRDKCESGVPVQQVPFSLMPSIGAHIISAQIRSDLIGIDIHNLTRGDGDNRAKRKAALARVANQPRPPGYSWDEYPYASTREGGANSYIALVPVPEQDTQRDFLRDWYRNNGMPPGSGKRFCVVVVP